MLRTAGEATETDGAIGGKTDEKRSRRWFEQGEFGLLHVDLDVGGLLEETQVENEDGMAAAFEHGAHQTSKGAGQEAYAPAGGVEIAPLDGFGGHAVGDVDLAKLGQKLLLVSHGEEGDNLGGTKQSQPGSGIDGTKQVAGKERDLERDSLASVLAHRGLDREVMGNGELFTTTGDHLFTSGPTVDGEPRKAWVRAKDGVGVRPGLL